MCIRNIFIMNTDLKNVTYFWKWFPKVADYGLYQLGTEVRFQRQVCPGVAREPRSRNLQMWLVLLIAFTLTRNSCIYFVFEHIMRSKREYNYYICLRIKHVYNLNIKSAKYILKFFWLQLNYQLRVLRNFFYKYAKTFLYYEILKDIFLIYIINVVFITGIAVVVLV